MKHVFVIQDDSGYVVGATYEQDKAIQIVREHPRWTYRTVPFYSCEGTEIHVIAGPIPSEYLPYPSTPSK